MRATKTPKHINQSAGNYLIDLYLRPIYLDLYMPFADIQTLVKPISFHSDSKI